VSASRQYFLKLGFVGLIGVGLLGMGVALARQGMVVWPSISSAAGAVVLFLLGAVEGRRSVLGLAEERAGGVR
jgi:hypothetical protein